jgi:hypothetical protein
MGMGVGSAIINCFANLLYCMNHCIMYLFSSAMFYDLNLKLVEK